MVNAKLVTFLSILIFTVLSIGCGGGGGGGNGIALQQGSIEPQARIVADFSNISYPIDVYLPPGYGDDPEVRYPVLYMLDSEFWFSTVVRLVRSTQKSIIVVGIGNTDRQSQGRRAIDYRLPGARDYFQFLVSQVVPYIDDNYLSDTLDRTLSGHSFGGLFVGAAILLEDPANRYFNRYLSQDGSFWYLFGEIEALERQFSSLSTELPAQIVLAGARGASGNLMYVRQFRDLLESRNYSNIDLRLWSYSVDHDAQFPLSMEEALELFY